MASQNTNQAHLLPFWMCNIKHIDMPHNITPPHCCEKLCSICRFDCNAICHIHTVLNSRIICRQLLPAVVFCFSKKRVDQLADSLAGMDLTSTSEKSRIQVFFDRAIGRLREADRQLPQLLRLREMLHRGLGVHHAGLATLASFRCCTLRVKCRDDH